MTRTLKLVWLLLLHDLRVLWLGFLIWRHNKLVQALKREVAAL
jgi:hypothetical protein